MFGGHTRANRHSLEKSGDLALARLSAAGDRAAFRVLSERSAGPVRSLMLRLGAQPALADDLTQDALIAGWRGIDGYRGEAAFVSWLMRIAARLYFKHVRKAGMTDIVEEVPGQDDGLEGRSQQRLDLDSALACLSEPERVCVTLCHGAGMTHEEISEGLNMPVGTVKSHVRRGVIKLRERLEPERMVANG